MVKLVIFDWDGTLFDSIDKICSCMLQAAEHAMAPKREFHDIQNIIGLSLDEGIKVVWPELPVDTLDKIKMHYKRLYVQADQSPPLAYDGMFELLEQLKGQGVLLAVATGKTRRGLDRIMSLTETGHYFATTRCADEALSKPHPMMLEQILAELNVLPEDAVMVGDTEYDLNMARAAGVASIGVSYGAHDKKRLASCQPQTIVDNLYQLASILGK